MSKIAYVFPGQGAQFKGMGADLFPLFREETKKASSLLGYDIENLCLEDANDQLKSTQFTQPTIYFVSCLDYMKRKKESGNKPDFVCGHSLGEYSAMFAAGVFDLFTGLLIVNKRAELMGKIKNGSLMAIIGPEVSNLNQILSDESISTIDIANFNTPDQAVIGGPTADLENLKVVLEKYGFRCVELNVSGAFHTRYMEPARIEYMRFLMNFDFHNPTIPTISSCTGSLLDPKYILETLGFQLVKSVRWVKTIKTLMSMSVNTFIEVGPGEILTRLNKKIFL